MSLPRDSLSISPTSDAERSRELQRVKAIANCALGGSLALLIVAKIL
jgi:hypothetical protein